MGIRIKHNQEEANKFLLKEEYKAKFDFICQHMMVFLWRFHLNINQCK